MCFRRCRLENEHGHCSMIYEAKEFQEVTGLDLCYAAGRPNYLSCGKFEFCDQEISTKAWNTWNEYMRLKNVV